MKRVITIVFISFLEACKSHQGGAETFPVFDLLLIDSVTRINTATVKEGDPIVLLYFSPECEHCQKETESILQAMPAMKKTWFYFVTNDPLKDLQIFGRHYKLERYPNITLGRDDQFFLLRHFKGAYPPYLVIYDRQKRQRAAYQGETPVDTIISLLNHL